MPNPIKVLIVDDSPAVRQAMSAVLAADPQLEVIGAAGDPYEAVQHMRELKPDVITLDIEMPRMDGLTFLQRIMAQHPIPVIICSSHAVDGAEATIRAFEFGAVDVIAKPRVGTEVFFAESQILICDAVKAAASVRPDRLATRSVTRRKLSADAVLAKGRENATVSDTEAIVVIGASTGGTEAVGVLLEAMPTDAPGIVVVQHMPENFTRSFAHNLDTFCRVHVKEAADNDVVRPGLALIAPGGKHTLIKRVGRQYQVEVRDGPLVSRHRPSVDVLFRSAARFAGRNAIGVILTGMGDDGAQGLKELRDAGARTFAQDEASSVVFGMPKEAIALGGVQQVLPLDQLPAAILQSRATNSRLRP
jgi:two-component system chemotaxis response regulator CheB